MAKTNGEDRPEEKRTEKDSGGNGEHPDPKPAD